MKLRCIDTAKLHPGTPNHIEAVINGGRILYRLGTEICYVDRTAKRLQK